MGDFYVDPAAPDGGTGSMAAPLSRQDLAVAAATGSNDTIWLKRGHVYQACGSQIAPLYLAGKSPSGRLRVRSYGDAAMPPTMFAGTNMLPGDAGWAYIGSGLWRKALADHGYADPYGMRLFAGHSRPTGPAVGRSLGTGYSLGTPRARYAAAKGATEAQVLAAVGTMGYLAPRVWTYTAGSTGGNGVLYVWTGSAALDPPTYYDGITLVGANNLYDAAGFGRPYGALIYNCSRVEVSEVDVLFAPAALRITGNVAQSESAFTDCNGRAFGVSGLLIEGKAVGAEQSGAVARRCVLDASGSLAEEWNSREEAGYSWINGAQDGAVIGRWTAGCTFDAVTVKDAAHMGIFVGAMTSTGSGTTAGAAMTDCASSSPNRIYGGYLGCSGLGAGNVATVSRYAGSDAVSFLSRSGSGRLTINESSFQAAKAPFPDYDYTSHPTGKGIVSIPGIAMFSAAGWGAIEPGALVLNGCTIEQPYGFMLALQEFGTPGAIPAGAMEFNDCALVDTAWLGVREARTFKPGLYDKPGVSIDSRDCATPGAVKASASTYRTGASGAQRVATSNTTSVALAAWPVLSGVLTEEDAP